MARIYKATIEIHGRDVAIEGRDVVVEAYHYVMLPGREVLNHIRLYVKAWDDEVDVELSLSEACEVRAALTAAIKELESSEEE